MTIIQEQQAAFFWVGLIGVIATGAVLGVGGDNYWALANVGSLDPSVESVKGRALMIALAVVVVLFDLAAFGVIFAGARHRRSAPSGSCLMPARRSWLPSTPGAPSCGR